MVNLDLFYRPVKTRFKKKCETTVPEIDRYHVLWLDTILITGAILHTLSCAMFQHKTNKTCKYTHKNTRLLGCLHGDIP